MRERARHCGGVSKHGVRICNAIVEAPALRLVSRHVAPEKKKLARATLPDDARKNRARAHVGPGESNAHEQERHLASRGADAKIARHGEDGTCTHADTTDGGDDWLRTGTHRFHEIAGHLREREKA